MYSLISMRTMAFSSSNRKSASALASSVLPTPVGPRNRNEPVGRFGSAMPARERRTASDTAWMASFWPMTRLPRYSSMFRSFSFSPCMRRPTGMPVQSETISATESASTWSGTIGSLSVSAASASSAARSAAASSFWMAGISPYRMRLAFSRSPSRAALSASTRLASSWARRSPTLLWPAFSASQRAVRPLSFSRVLASSACSLPRRSLDAGSSAFFSCISSISRRVTLRCSSSISSGCESSSIRRWAAASSTKSMALSGS